MVERTAELSAAEAAAQLVRSQLTDAIECISEGFALYDADDCLVIANRRYREIMLSDADDALTAGMQFSGIVVHAAETGTFPNATKDPIAWIDRQIDRHSSGGEVFIQEVANDRWHQTSTRRTDAGGTVALHADITDIKRISDELMTAREAAEAASEAKSSFLATMSYEIRTPLNGIIGVSTLLQHTDLGAEQQDLCDTIGTAADSLLAVINDILDFSKVEAGALELEIIAFDLSEVIEGTLGLTFAKATQKGIALACRIDPDVPPGIFGDAMRLRQILLNLLNNAVKFTENGEVILTVSRLNIGTTEISTTAQTDDMSLLEFSLRDTEIGIPADRVNRLFQSFSQVDPSTTRRYGSTGLGLPLPNGW